MSSPAEFPNSEPSLHLSQVDPPHPFKSAWKTFAIAAVILLAVAAIYFYSIQRPPVAAGQILEVNYYPVHSTTSGEGGMGTPGASQSYDQLIVLAKVRVRNQTNIPLFLEDISATATMPDNSQQSSTGAGANDFERLFQAFPALASLRSEPFNRNATLSPGESLEGLAIFSFPITRQQWDGRKAGNVVISFIHQQNLLLSFPH